MLAWCLHVLALMASTWIASTTLAASTPKFGIHQLTGANTLLSEPNPAIEPALAPVLEAEARRLLERTLPRAKTAECRKKIKETAAHIRERFDRHFLRHPFAELHCPIASLAPTEWFSQSDSILTIEKPP